MKCFLPITCSLFAFSIQLPADTLSDAERLKLVEKLETVFETVNSNSTGRLKTALTAFRNARNSDDAALDLYLKCIEKQSFTDEKRKPQEFREWKRRKAEEFKRAGFTLALRHQLNWLVIALEAEHGFKDPGQTAIAATKAIAAILDDREELTKQIGFLEKNVFDSPFAKAYKIQKPAKKTPPEKKEKTTGDKSEEKKKVSIPHAILPIGKVYENAVFPPLRENKKLSTLRTGWVKRILQEEMFLKAKSDLRNNRDTTAEYDTFLTEQQPRLRWAMEKDLFVHGDGRTASNAMYTLIQENIDHPDAKKWVEEFKKLLTPDEK